MANKVIINPTFRNGIDGKLFRNKNSNKNVQETILLNNLFTRLSIAKGDLALFPSVGLRQHLGKLVFNDSVDSAMILDKFEQDLSDQMNRECSLDYELDPDDKIIRMKISLEGLRNAVQLEYYSTNGSIRVIEPQFD